MRKATQDCHAIEQIGSSEVRRLVRKGELVPDGWSMPTGSWEEAEEDARLRKTGPGASVRKPAKDYDPKKYEPKPLVEPDGS
jgi:hypothetical protein